MRGHARRLCRRGRAVYNLILWSLAGSAVIPRLRREGPGARLVVTSAGRILSECGGCGRCGHRQSNSEGFTRSHDDPLLSNVELTLSCYCWDAHACRRRASGLAEFSPVLEISDAASASVDAAHALKRISCSDASTFLFDFPVTGCFLKTTPCSYRRGIEQNCLQLRRFLTVNTRIRRKKRKIPCYIAGNSPADGCDHHCLASQAVKRSARLPSNARMGRKSRLFAHSISSLDAQFADFEVEIAQKSPALSRIFPFRGDYRRRLVLITTVALR
jgi:hypothetical protein